MFVIVDIKDYVHIPPWKFGIPLRSAVTENLNSKLANKVVIGSGLGITLWDITKIGDSHILPGDGGHHTYVEFRFIMFRPFINEIITGRVKSSTREGLHITLGFFDDIFIPKAALQHPSRFDEVEQVWVWEYQTDDGSHDLFMDVGEPVKFRVTGELFEETSPKGPETNTEQNNSLVELKVPYSLVGTVNEPGLGLLSWWNREEDPSETI